MSDRVFALVWLGVCTLIAVQMWMLSVPFTYEPVGPKGFPLLLSALMAICCIALIASPERNSEFPSGALLGKVTLMAGLLLAYAFLFERLGYFLSTAAMVLSVARLFGGSWLSSGVSAGLIAVLGYYVFDGLLNISLPSGLFWD